MTFNSSYVQFSSYTEPYQRADDVGFAITEFMWFKGYPFYAIGALTEAKVAYARLAQGAFEETDQDNVDLVFRMSQTGGGYFFELVLRSDKGTAYGGWLWGENLEVTDEFINGYRVLATTHAAGRTHFAYSRRRRGYQCIGRPPVDKASLVMPRRTRGFDADA
ncbi:hypothetical protein J2858_004461 [Neorhizobium galegae]|uniref:hypothetical protein n=1 Tax=Rhizobium/Agrobacterium group TaxID=227290 RepID=UPI001AE1FD93|nr:hypothetical protein [Neorhizobium galegae]MBP2551519.1 hypothetical protein [Neorhizobium galegae]